MFLNLFDDSAVLQPLQIQGLFGNDFFSYIAYVEPG
jgi:hypothetical protein